MDTVLPKKNRLSHKLQQDIVKIDGKTIFINPFLYWRRIDDNTKIWLKESGQISQDHININRNRFYPELDWSLLDNQDKCIKDGTIEFFLKTIDLVKTYHPNLSTSQILQVERQMVILKKNTFEKFVKTSFAKKAKALINKQRNLERDRFLREWHEWFYSKNTQKAIFPIFIMVFIAAFIGWAAGISKNSCNPYFEQNIDQLN